MAKKKNPLAFMSYARVDDKFGDLTKLRERIAHEVSMALGREFLIFQDWQDIGWGQSWQQVIREGLTEAIFFIPILTPSFFNSEACREELESFLEREGKLGRNDLILPVYYVDCPLLNDEERRAGDNLAAILSGRQRFDWRELRTQPLTDPRVREELARMARQVRDALERVGDETKGEEASARKAAPVVARTATTLGAQEFGETAQGAADEQQAATGKGLASAEPVAKTEPPTWIVDPMHRGHFATISEAIARANPGDRILVRPGLYREGIKMTKPLEIVGQGELGDVRVEARGSNALLFQATMGRVVNLTLKQAGEGDWYGVDIAQGRLELEGCDITSDSLSCVGIHGGADPRLRRNRIHDSKKSTGVFVQESGQGLLEDNEIFANELSGIEIKTGGNPTVRRNRIHDSKKGSGVFVQESGQGLLEDNEIFANELAIQIKTGGNPTMRRNRIHDSKKGGGVFVYENGLGLIEENEVFANKRAGITVTTGGNPTVRRNRINKNGYEAIWVHEKGGGTFEDNDLRDNARGAWDIADDSKEKVTRSGNIE